MASANVREDCVAGTIVLYLMVSAIVDTPYLKWRQTIPLVGRGSTGEGA